MKVVIQTSFETPEAAADGLRRIASQILKGKKRGQKPRFYIDDETATAVEQPPLLVELTATTEEEQGLPNNFGMNEQQWNAELYAAAEYMERWGLNDTLSWLQERNNWGMFEARTLVAQIGHRTEA